MPSLWAPIYWGAVLGMIGLSTIASASSDIFLEVMMATAGAGAIGGVVVGTSAQAYALASGAAARFHLPAPQERRLLDE